MPFEVICYTKKDKDGNDYFAYKVCDENDKCVECDSDIEAFALRDKKRAEEKIKKGNNEVKVNNSNKSKNIRNISDNGTEPEKAPE